MKNYFIVSPVRNEEKSLPNIIRSIKNQTIKPFLWIIVDDGSKDRTPQILKKLKNENDWVHIITLEKSDEYMGMHYSYVCKKGFDYGISYCKKQKKNYNYIGLIDTDIELSKDYFEVLIKKMESNRNLGICSGAAYYKTKEGLRPAMSRPDLPTGGARIWRRKCYEDTGGYHITRAPDSISNVKAKIAG